MLIKIPVYLIQLSHTLGEFSTPSHFWGGNQAMHLTSFHTSINVATPIPFI